MYGTTHRLESSSALALGATDENRPRPFTIDLANTDEFRISRDPRQGLSYWLQRFTNLSQLNSREDIIHAIHRDIANIDHMINEQLNEIIRHPKLQRLEATWRGLWSLLIEADSTKAQAKNIKIKILDISWGEVVKDIDRALEFDQSHLFQKIYNEEYGTPGGEPYGILLGDYAISHRPSARHPHNDIAALQGIAQIAAAAFSPFICSASSELLGMDDFSALGLPLNLSAIFNQVEYNKWRSLREHSDSRFIGLTLPRILLRAPYRTQPGSYKGVFFYDKPTDGNHETALWGNACYAFGKILIREFASVGWFGHIRGVPRNQMGGGLLNNLIIDSFATDRDGVIHKPVTDVVITDKLERELSDLGLIPLCQCYDTPLAAFYSNASVFKTQANVNKDVEANSKLSAMLQHTLCGSRIAHYIKVMIRDKIGSFVTAEDCENYLRNWLFKYTTGREDLEWEEQARYPLREAAVTVKEHREKTGTYMCVIHLRPHYQLDQMVSELQLVTELAQSS